ncbi:SDR family oxidoreductase [Myxococcus sp. RHSTA-1-4]|uniref:SDR family oxidoreductase n=1 Tax=Myxococcus sp. RHSTA-1-4 TaxID=2874601 RepID=UPI001CBB3BFB|nr:SDR family oxidoreductase [Myxococcus sp. RHSTA-1-4]MBZ4417059.1 SDR family oxidoreductase [Myxococcus sp. RHSTA-1-4]
MKPLEGRIALVAGATRGAGRGIATMLGEAGATVYCTGRSVRGRPASGDKRPETIEETAELVTARGGRGLAVRVDHSVEEEVVALCERIRSEQGRLDVLVNDIWGGDALAEFGPPFWKQSAANGQRMYERAVFTHLITSRHAVPLMVEQDRGLIIEITDGDSFGYRGSLWYDLVKLSVIRIAFTMSRDLRRTKVTALALTPGFLRSEEMLENFGVTEANWRDGAKKDPHFIASESPAYVGRAVAALAADPHVGTKAGRVFSSWGLAREYGFTDLDGSQPHWGEYFAKAFGHPWPVADEAAYASWRNGPTDLACPDWPVY